MNLEFYSSNLYLQMSAWWVKNGFDGTAKFLAGTCSRRNATGAIHLFE